MAYVKRHSLFTQDLPILFSGNDLSTPHTCRITDTGISLNAEGVKAVPAGLFVVRSASGDDRYLKRAYATVAFSTGSATGTITPVLANLFEVGDVLTVPIPYATLTIGGTYLATERVAVTVGTRRITVVTGSTTNSTIATNVAAGINADPVFNGIVEAKAEAGVVYVYAKNGFSDYAFVVAARNAADAGASAAGTATASAANLGLATIGTIQTISTAGVVTLTANASVAVPVGGYVGVNQVGEYLGVDIHGRDFTDVPVNMFGAYYSASGVYQQNLPYFDPSIAVKLPSLNFSTKF